MLSKPLYEALPYCYIAIGSLSLLIIEQPFAQVLAIIVFLLGSRVYALRSNNRRTDSKKRRKKGWLPTQVYEHIPALCFLGALLSSKLDAKIAPVVGLCLCSYSMYIFLRRLSYRKHKVIHSSYI